MNSVVGLFEHYNEAEKALDALKEVGIDNKRISIITRESDGLRGNIGHAKKKGIEGAKKGGLVGLLAGIGALTVPGVGAVVATGTLASTLVSMLGATAVSAGVGAATGGLVGALMDLGYTREDAEFFSTGIKRGGVLISVKTDSISQERVKEILSSSGAVDLVTRRQQWEDDPEKKFFEGWNQNM